MQVQSLSETVTVTGEAPVTAWTTPRKQIVHGQLQWPARLRNQTRPPGTYTLTAELQGFGTVTVERTRGRADHAGFEVAQCQRDAREHRILCVEHYALNDASNLRLGRNRVSKGCHQQ